MAEVKIKVTADDKASKQFKAMGKELVALGAVAAAMGVAITKAFEFGKEGAAIDQTAKSFQNLTQQLGASTNLLQGLREASRGTISDTGIMSNTMTLLAGVTGEFGSNLANATPELLNIAKAASALNPTLLTTEFAYQSLATGIKRSSALFLDNLGLVIKIGDANKTYAAEIGKAVSELTAADKQQALLNETLRAGAVLIEQAGGAAESATDSYAQLEASWANLTDTGKTLVADAIEPTVSGLASVLAALVEGEGAWKAYIRAEKEFFRNLIPGEIDDAATSMFDFSDATEAFVNRIQDGVVGITQYTAQAEAMRSVNELTTEGWSDLINELERGEPVWGAITEDIREYGRELGIISGVHEFVGTTITGLGTHLQEFEKTTEDTTGAIESWLEVLDSGADAELRNYDNALLAIVAAYQRGDLTADQFKAALLELQDAMETSSPVVDSYAGVVWNFGSAWASAAAGVQNTLTQLHNLLNFLNAHPELFSAQTQRTFVGVINEENGDPVIPDPTGGNGIINPGGANDPGFIPPGGGPDPDPGGESATLNLVLDGQVLGSIVSTQLGALVRESMQGAGAFTGL